MYETLACSDLGVGVGNDPILGVGVGRAADATRSRGVGLGENKTSRVVLRYIAVDRLTTLTHSPDGAHTHTLRRRHRFQNRRCRTVRCRPASTAGSSTTATMPARFLGSSSCRRVVFVGCRRLQASHGSCHAAGRRCDCRIVAVGGEPGDLDTQLGVFLHQSVQLGFHRVVVTLQANHHHHTPAAAERRDPQ